MLCAHIKNSHDIIPWSWISFLSLWDRKYSCHLLAPSSLGLSTSTLWVSGWSSPAPCSVGSPCTPDTMTVIPGHLRKCRKLTRFGTTSFSHVRRWHGQACMVSGRKVLVPVETQQVGTTRLDSFHCSQVFGKHVKISGSKTKLFRYQEQGQARKKLRVGSKKSKLS